LRISKCNVCRYAEALVAAGKMRPDCADAALRVAATGAVVKAGRYKLNAVDPLKCS
jgi:hypothetical protein